MSGWKQRARSVQAYAVRVADFARRRLTAQRYGNSLPILLNHRYIRHQARCRDAYPGNGAHSPFAEDMSRDGFVVIENAIDPAKARAMSERISQHCALAPSDKKRGQTAHLQYVVGDPFAVLGNEVLDLFRGPADPIIRSHLGSWYRLYQVKCYRSLSTTNPVGAWLWHMDNYPPGVIKIMLYLTDCDQQRGVTNLIPLSQTKALQAAGYYGVHQAERTDTLSHYARKCGIALDIRQRPVAAGSAILFNVNTLHRANIPQVGYRDVITFTLMPSPIPWQEALEIDGAAKLANERTLYPADPAATDPKRQPRPAAAR